MFTFITHIEERKKITATKLCLPLTRIDFAVRISSRAVGVFLALSLRCVWGTSFLSHGFPRKLRLGPYDAYDKFVYYIDMIVLLENTPLAKVNNNNNKQTYINIIC